MGDNPNKPRHETSSLLETRSASIGGVDTEQRIITVVAVPYEQPTEVMYRQEVWSEVFSRTAFEGLQTSNRKITANREHNPEHLVGRIVASHPDGPDGLVTEVKISRTERGNETLELARDDVLSASVGFMIKDPRWDQTLDRSSKTRRINRAFLEHLAFVGTPAYPGAKVLAVRSPQLGGEADLPPIVTPNLDGYYSDPLFRWASERVQ